MYIQRYRYLLITLVLFFFFFFKLYFIFLVFLLFRDSYKWLKEDTLEFNYIEYIKHRSLYEEVDYEPQDIDTWFYEELYLIFGCKIYFDIYGGFRVLELIDYFWNNYKFYDFRNLNNIFEVIYFKTKYTFITNYYLRNEYILYILKEKYLNKLNKKSFLDFFKDDKFYLIEYNNELKILNKLINKKSLNWFKNYNNKYEKNI